ncbi:flagellar biosynthesis repressor FlbT [Methylopila turkensis]|uniref:Flagellum biosynthesis repressor protein FlbT 1 n=1 Tax=Methylopila turkensis TaxID=1437816 RepID=A0A9W6JN65_9HYPH|nr:flagellar biosynthesis repressor FlbT [Methylopila turkensis]GLK78784.1 putative flagellum biosynthesis repressor protein FlbT 1 [Methylopila turkensis]
MTLKVELKPGERIVIGRSVVTNGAARTQLLIDGGDPVLRERDILQERDADTPAKRIYYTVQMMYMAGSIEKVSKIYSALTRDAVKAAPSMLPLIDRINNHVLTGALYKALREARSLVAHEKGIFEHAERSAGVRADGANDG